MTYIINENDEIVFVSEGWDAGAAENNAPELCEEKILSRSLWDFISDPTVRQLYVNIIEMVRAGESLEFTLNCDAPGKFRWMTMTITQAERENGAVQFQTRVDSVENRTPEQLLIDKNVSRNKELISMCSWCKSIDTGHGDEWEYLDIAVSRLGLFNRTELPALTHGMCPSCYRDIAGKLVKRKNVS